MTLNLSESNKQSNYYLTQINEIRDLNETTQTQVDDIQTDVNTVKTDLSTAQGQISALITAGSAGESQIALDAVIVDTETNTSDISDMKIDITDIQAKTAFIESVTASSTTQTEKTTYLNSAKEVVGHIGPENDNLLIGCSGTKSLTLNPDQGYISHYCEMTHFGDNLGPGRLVLHNTVDKSGSIQINNEVQNHAYTDADHTRLNNVDSDIAGVQTQINTINTDVSAVTTENVATQVQLDIVAADLDTAETFILGHTDDIAALTVLINTNKTNIESNDTDITGILTDIDTINTTIANGGGASNQTQVDAIQVSVDAHTDDITDLTSLVNTNTNNIQSNDVDITSINTQLGTINTNVTAVSAANSATQLELDGVVIDLNTAETTIANHTTQIDTINTNVTTVSSANSATQLELDGVVIGLNDAIIDIEANRVTSAQNTFDIGQNNTVLGDRITNNDNDITNIQTQLDANTSAIIATDTVFNDIDISILEVENNVETNRVDILALGTDDTKQTNYISTIVSDPFITTYSDHFNFDVICYYDFSDKNKLGRDVSGKNLHALNTHGVEHSTENTHSAYFKKISHAVSAGQHINQRHLNCSSALPYLKQVEYTISCNILPLDTESAIFAFTKNDVSNSYFYAYLGGGYLQVIYKFGNFLALKILYPFAIDGNWHNITFTNKATRNALYVDNVEVDASYYTDGTINTSCDLSSMDETTDKFIIGAISIALSNRGDVFRYPYEGYISDFIVYNRVITNLEIAMLSSGVIGYDVILLVGQSNMTGEAYIQAGIDDDYSLHQNRVYQYETKSNIDISASPYNYNTTTNVMSIASGPLDHPQPATLVPTKMGPWKTFIDDYIRYSDIPFRKNILVVPLAAGGSSFLQRWNVGLINYEIALKAMDQVMDISLNPSKSYKVTAMLFNMGEADITLQNMNFKTDFITTYNSFVANLNGFDANVPVVLTQISGEYEAHRYINGGINVSTQEVINAELVELSNEYDKFQLALTEGLEYRPDYIHLEITGYRALGERMFDKYMSALGKVNKKPAYGVDNNIKDVVMQSDLLLKPKNELDQWKNLSLDCFASKELTILCTGALTDTITLKFVKLGPIVIVSMDNLMFTADANGAIDVAVGSIPEELATNMTHKYTCNTHTITFITDGDFLITNNDIAGGNMYTAGTVYLLQAFFCMYTTN